MQERATDAKDLEASQALPQHNHQRLQAMFAKYHNVVWRTLRRYGLDPETAADVGQQAYLVAVERIDDIWPGSERAFLLGSALRLARKHRRGATRLQLESNMDASVRVQEGAESRAITLELLDRVLSQLDDDLIEAFILFDVEEFTTREVASALSLAEGTVASRVRRAREAFRAITRRLDRVSEREEGGNP